jgi:hypothetical protein
MKTNETRSDRFNPTKRLVGALTTCAALTSAFQASAIVGFNLGDAANYSVIFQGGGNNDLNINNGPGINDLAVSGKIGIDNTGPLHDGHLQLSGPLTLNSDVHFSGTYTQGVQDNGPYSGNIQVNGTISGGHANVHGDMLYLNSLSTALGLESGNSVALNSGATINGSSGLLDVSGNRVFTVSGINAPNGILTINGDGISKIVFNISAAANANFHFNSIVLGGGLTSDDVLFNFFGGNDTTLSGGPTLDINSNGDVGDPALYGIFLDPNGQISIVHSVLFGRIYGGDSHNEQIVSGAQINGPAGTPVPEASTVVAGALLLIPLGVSTLRILRKKMNA